MTDRAPGEFGTHDRPWWRRAVIYQIYPRSFADVSGDGVGDLAGISSRLEYLQWLGIDAVWLSPIYRSPMADFGYDVADHCAIDPLFGDLDAFDELLAGCHQAGLRLLLDWVPNHTSDQHRWFREARQSRGSARRDWYVWRDGTGEEPPNNWLAAFGGRAWTWDEATSQWYLHLFLPEQPDLNWNNRAVVSAQHDVLRFWLDRGVDGFRADVVHLIGKDENLADQPAHLAHLDLVGVHDNPRTHDLLRDIRAVLDGYPGDRVMVGEVNLRSAELIAPYYGHGDELHLVFNFALLRARWDAAEWAAIIDDAERATSARDAWPVWVLSNHDQVRQRSRYGGSERRAQVAAVVLLTLRGTPFLYAGEELGLADAVIPADERVDAGGRDGCRAPIPWDGDAEHGWPAAPWLPFPPDADARNAAALAEDPSSTLNLYRRLLAHRRASPALIDGSWEPLPCPTGVLAFERRDGDDRRVIIANFAGTAATLRVDGDWQVEIDSTDPTGGTLWDGAVDAEQALVLRPASRRQGSSSVLSHTDAAGSSVTGPASVPRRGNSTSM